MKYPHWLSMGGVLSATLASLCCLGPVLISAAGIAGIGAFSFFERYRPLLIGITVSTLAIAFVLVYGKSESACPDGSCRVGPSRNRSKFIVWMAAFAAVLSIAYPNLAGAPYDRDRSAAGPSARRIEITVQGMTCVGCNANVESAVRSVDGVSLAQADFRLNSVTVEVDPARATVEQIVDRIRETKVYRALMPDSTVE
jgi:copper chaperone CopZ